MSSCSESRHLESAVRTAIISVLGNNLQMRVTNYFNDRLGSTTVEVLIHYLDEQFQLMSNVEDKRAIQDFKKFERGSRTMQAFLTEYRSLLERAQAAGFQPASDLAEDLIRLSQLGQQPHAILVGLIQKRELESGSRLLGYERRRRAATR